MSNTSTTVAGLATCSCGHDRNHTLVRKKGEYSFWGWLALGMGATVVPRKLNFFCQKCGELIESTTDPDILNKEV